MIAKRISELDRVFKNPKMKVIGYKDGEEVLGYIVFTFKQVDSENFIRNNMVIKEFVYENRDVLLELLTFLNSQSDQIERIIFNTQDEFFYYLLKDPRNGTNNLIPSVYHESNVSGVGLMYRIIDVRGIFEVLRNHNFGGQSCKVRFDIADTFLRENRRSVTVQFKDGQPQIANNESTHKVKVSMDISEFSSMFMGCVPFKKLYRYGLAEISDTRCIDVINKLFWTGEKPICTTEF